MSPIDKAPFEACACRLFRISYGRFLRIIKLNTYGSLNPEKFLEENQILFGKILHQTYRQFFQDHG